MASEKTDAMSSLLMRPSPPQYNNERQDYKIGTVCLWEGKGWMKEMKVRKYS
jgi:hypothetical protein